MMCTKRYIKCNHEDRWRNTCDQTNNHQGMRGVLRHDLKEKRVDATLHVEPSWEYLREGQCYWRITRSTTLQILDMRRIIRDLSCGVEGSVHRDSMGISGVLLKDCPRATWSSNPGWENLMGLKLGVPSVFKGGGAWGLSGNVKTFSGWNDHGPWKWWDDFKSVEERVMYPTKDFPFSEAYYFQHCRISLCKRSIWPGAGRTCRNQLSVEFLYA